MTVQCVPDTGFVPAITAKKGAGRSSFGMQSSSLRQNAPNFSYGHSTRDDRGKMFLSAGHVNVENRGRAGPGHLYDVPGALDTQPSSQKNSAPNFSFSQSERMPDIDPWTPGPGTYPKKSSLGMQTLSSKTSCPEFGFGSTRREQRSKMFMSSDHVKELKGTQGPDPGTYPPISGYGSQVLSSRRTAPSFSMPKVDRLRNDYEKMASSLPPVGMYETWGSIGKQTLSKSATMPAFGFGRRSSRAGETKRFLSSAHVQENKGTYSPSNYDHQQGQNLSSLGPQGLSKRSNAPNTKFGSAPRMVFKTNNTPGPGSYE